MSFIERFFQTGDPVERIGGHALEIDRILRELGQLYVLRSQATRTGSAHDVQTIMAQINVLKIKLSQL